MAKKNNRKIKRLRSFANMYFIKHKTGQLLSCLIFFAAACKNKPAYNSYIPTRADTLQQQKRAAAAFIKIDSAKTIIKTGDLIVRTGNDFTSESLRSLNQRDQTYSHCGIAVLQHDTVFVYHALGGEWNPDQKIRKDVLQVFAEPYSNRGIGIYRYNITVADKENLVTTVSALQQGGIMFDMKFDLQSNDRMYCAEFVYKSYILAANGKLQFNISHIGNFNFIGVDDLFLVPGCHLQKKILY
jgi:Permuted papain-like amidase enzyme, YaeF/YiiX, C92 family